MECVFKFLLTYTKKKRVNMHPRFLLARLHMDFLKNQPTVGHIKQVLQDIPQKMNGLDETYEQAMRRIKDQEKEYQEMAKQVLYWVTHAKRALFIAEIQHALAIRKGTLELNKDFL